jgi:hypothetical protein
LNVERIVGDPPFKESLDKALVGRRFDLVIATYGRIRHVAQVLREHTERLITIGGSPGFRGSHQPEVLFPAGQIYNCGDDHQLTLAQWVELICHTLDSELEIVSVPGAYAFPARDLMIGRKTSHHQLFDLHKIRAELGYRDEVPVLQALPASVRWYLDNPPVSDAEKDEILARHYRTEDAMADVQARYQTELAAVDHVDPGYRHPYAHPKKPGRQKDHHGR